MCINISKVLNYFFIFIKFIRIMVILFMVYIFILMFSKFILIVIYKEIFIWYKILKKNGLYVGNGKVMWFKCLGYFFCFML